MWGAWAVEDEGVGAEGDGGRAGLDYAVRGGGGEEGGVGDEGFVFVVGGYGEAGLVEVSIGVRLILGVSREEEGSLQRRIGSESGCGVRRGGPVIELDDAVPYRV